FGLPSERRTTPAGREAVDTLVYTEAEIARLLRAAFALARQRRRKLTSVDKANILSSSRLWRELEHEIRREYPDVAYEDVLVDAMAMHLIRRPRDFDVIATENLFGDILTDEASMLAGSMGMLPSASLAGAPAPGERCRGLYEPIHGSAPDIAGLDRANPLAAILSAAMLCRYSLAAPEAAEAIERAVAAVVAAGHRPPAGCVGDARRTGLPPAAGRTRVARPPPPPPGSLAGLQRSRRERPVTWRGRSASQTLSGRRARRRAPRKWGPVHDGCWKRG